MRTGSASCRPMRGLLRLGEEEWLNHVTKVASLFFEAFLVEEVVVGGGNAHRLRELPAYARSPSTRRGGMAKSCYEGRESIFRSVPGRGSRSRRRKCAQAPRVAGLCAVSFD